MVYGMAYGIWHMAYGIWHRRLSRLWHIMAYYGILWHIAYKKDGISPVVDLVEGPYHIAHIHTYTHTHTHIHTHTYTQTHTHTHTHL
jgi:hypothetical protein